MAQTLVAGGTPLDFWTPEWTFGYPVPRTSQLLPYPLVVAVYFALAEAAPLLTVFLWIKYLAIAGVLLSFFAEARWLGLSTTTAAFATVFAPLLAAIGLGYFALRTGRQFTFAGPLVGLLPALPLRLRLFRRPHARTSSIWSTPPAASPDWPESAASVSWARPSKFARAYRRRHAQPLPLGTGLKVGCFGAGLAAWNTRDRRDTPERRLLIAPVLWILFFFGHRLRADLPCPVGRRRASRTHDPGAQRTPGKNPRLGPPQPRRPDRARPRPPDRHRIGGRAHIPALSYLYHAMPFTAD